ncbi:TetR/AcrR family transcriptional regulator [Paraburkholderia sp. SOS3]|jgi:TetR/AcrR family transcriptional repressor of nem operon|uniref:TetR/AcrR family transcriptional regulator n=1 Tax=Paraburkholderia sp. SOS3 TaxID=1926494 RepID=UPI0009474EBE|nr:TetR/AcrR family transcriptional regulator [Paraburkholderia sp. SOS3]APR39595.1 TetR family transcriptional regulator [Paraburkholderia sp. SOS3]
MTDTSATAPSRSRGRPREFDIDAALDKAVAVFCERGFYATSIVDLTNAMDLASGSVYKAFKDKQAVFIAAFDRMQATRDESLRRAVEPGLPPREAIHRVLMFHADASSGAAGKRGCLLAGSAMVLGTFEADVVQRVNTGFRKIETLIAALIRAGQKDGSISKRVDGEATARLMLCAMQGMRVIGKTGRTRAQMRQTADLAMKLLD